MTEQLIGDVYGVDVNLIDYSGDRLVLPKISEDIYIHKEAFRSGGLKSSRN